MANTVTSAEQGWRVPSSSPFDKLRRMKEEHPDGFVVRTLANNIEERGNTTYVVQQQPVRGNTIVGNFADGNITYHAESNYVSSIQTDPNNPMFIIEDVAGGDVRRDGQITSIVCQPGMSPPGGQNLQLPQGSPPLDPETKLLETEKEKEEGLEYKGCCGRMIKAINTCLAGIFRGTNPNLNCCNFSIF